MKISKNLTLGELAAFVATELKKSNIDCVLTGGAVPTGPLVIGNKIIKAEGEITISGNKI